MNFERHLVLCFSQFIVRGSDFRCSDSIRLVHADQWRERLNSRRAAGYERLVSLIDQDVAIGHMADIRNHTEGADRDLDVLLRGRVGNGRLVLDFRKVARSGRGFAT